MKARGIDNDAIGLNCEVQFNSGMNLHDFESDCSKPVTSNSTCHIPQGPRLLGHIEVEAVRYGLFPLAYYVLCLWSLKAYGVHIESTG